ncbi:tektin-2-like isoform X2 [Melanotaenia boesemani]|uniref:tektin-2-like isoform X2 n=1 Tax=Melanotaenia boesemani TaxID=1250792 RepID=UPI001C03A9C0|nr:tektin-2-like isoform X2 [Melanotaenia boesemani]
MWQGCVIHEDLLKSRNRLTPTALPDQYLLPNRPKRQRNQVQTVDNKIVSAFIYDDSQIPSVIHHTVGHLRSRLMEVSQWKTHISECISQVDQEISAVEQMKDVVEHCLHETQVYSHLMSDCVALSGSLSSSSLGPRQDPVLSDLKKEEQLTSESRELLQNHTYVLLDKLSSLQKIRHQLLGDFQDKCETIKLTKKCITDGPNMPCFQLPATQSKPTHVSHDDWHSHCKTLRLTANDLFKGSSLFRRNLQLFLVNLKNTQENLRRSTQSSLRRKIHELTRDNETLNWERQRIQNEISDLTKYIQIMTSQIRNCDSRLDQATHCLEMLNQRPRYELCRDHPHISLTRERWDLAKMTDRFFSALKRAQKDLELEQKHLVILDNKLVQNDRTLQVQQRCYNLHQSFLPALDNAVVLANKAMPQAATNSTHTHNNQQCSALAICWRV